MSSTVEKPHASAESLKLDMSQLERLTSLASSKNCAPDFLVQEAIERYLRAEEAQQTLMKSVDDSVAHFEATGLHITLDDAAVRAGALDPGEIETRFLGQAPRER